jgi:hypothetical protein
MIRAKFHCTILTLDSRNQGFCTIFAIDSRHQECARCLVSGVKKKKCKNGAMESFSHHFVPEMCSAHFVFSISFLKVSFF